MLLAIETGLALEQLADPSAVSLLQLPSVLGELAAFLAGGGQLAVGLVIGIVAAALRHRRGSLTMFFLPILRSVRRRGPTPSSLRRRPAYFAGSSPLPPR
jgi:hypothetical protein